MEELKTEVTMYTQLGTLLIHDSLVKKDLSVLSSSVLSISVSSSSFVASLALPPLPPPAPVSSSSWAAWLAFNASMS